MGLTYTNNAQSELASSLSSSATTLTLTPGSGDRFPDISAADASWFPLTLIRADGSGYEIVRATARNADSITIERGQENTPNALSFAVDDIVSLRMTSRAFDEFVKSGDEGLYLQSVNLATQTNSTNDPILLSIDGPSQLTDGLSVSFRPVADSVGVVSIKLNDFDEKPLRVPYAENILVGDGDLVASRLYTITYSQALDRWNLETPISIGQTFANSIGAGLVETLLSPSQNIYDPDNFPTSFSGAPKVPDRLSTSRIIRDFSTRIPLGYLPSTWTWRGDGAAGVLNGSRVLWAWTNPHFASATLPVDSTMTIGAGRVPAMRVQNDLAIAGTMLFLENRSVNPNPCIGPQSGSYYNSSTQTGNLFTGESPGFLQRQSVESGGAVSVNPDHLAAAIMQGAPLDWFHGAQGFGMANENADNRYVYGRQGCLIVCSNCTIDSTARFRLPTRANNNDAVVGAFDANEHATDDQQRLNVGRGGGGILIIASETLTIHPDSQWKVEGPEQDYRAFSQLQLAEDNQRFNRVFEYSGCGQLFHLNTLTGEIRRWI